MLVVGVVCVDFILSNDKFAISPEKAGAAVPTTASAAMTAKTAFQV